MKVFNNLSAAGMNGMLCGVLDNAQELSVCLIFSGPEHLSNPAQHLRKSVHIKKAEILNGVLYCWMTFLFSLLPEYLYTLLHWFRQPLLTL